MATDSGFGRCDRCAAPAIVKLGAVPLCLLHFEAALEGVRQQVDAIRPTQP